MTSAKAKLEKSVSGDAFPLDYSTSMRVIRDALHGVSPVPIVVSEGANTMDNARSALKLPGCCSPPPPPLIAMHFSIGFPPLSPPPCDSQLAGLSSAGSLWQQSVKYGLTSRFFQTAPDGAVPSVLYSAFLCPFDASSKLLFVVVTQPSCTCWSAVK